MIRTHDCLFFFLMLIIFLFVICVRIYKIKVVTTIFEFLFPIFWHFPPKESKEGKRLMSWQTNEAWNTTDSSPSISNLTSWSWRFFPNLNFPELFLRSLIRWVLNQVISLLFLLKILIPCALFKGFLGGIYAFIVDFRFLLWVFKIYIDYSICSEYFFCELGFWSFSWK